MKKSTYPLKISSSSLQTVEFPGRDPIVLSHEQNEAWPRSLAAASFSFSAVYMLTIVLPSRAKMTFQATPSTAMIEKHTPISTKAEPHPEPTCGTIWVEFAKEMSLGIKQMRAFAQHVQGNNFKTGILITQTALTPAAMKIIPVVHPSIIETFLETDLLVNITHHELVPKHVLLSAEEKQKLLQRYRLKESQLPRIQVGDPVAKYLGLRRGNVVKIIRKSETAGRYASYRWVI